MFVVWVTVTVTVTMTRRTVSRADIKKGRYFVSGKVILGIGFGLEGL